MLQTLEIKNFGLIKNANIDLKKGFTVVSGETGSGKSMLIKALSVLLGNSAKSDYIKHGEDKSYLNATFENNENIKMLLNEYDLPLEDELTISRIISKDGKSKARINGMSTPLSIIKIFKDYLVDIHSQFDNRLLIDSKNHIKLIDDYAKIDKSKYSKLFKEYTLIKKELKDLLNSKSNNEKLEIYEYQLNEINEANIDEFDEDFLVNKKKELNYFDKIKTNLDVCYDNISANGNVRDLLYEAVKGLEQISDINKSYKDLYTILNDAYYAIDDAKDSIRNELDGLYYSKEELDEVEKELYDFFKIKQKYGNSKREILNFKENLEILIDKIYNRDLYIKTIKESLSDIYKKCLVEAEKISNKRKKTSNVLKSKIEENLHLLCMENSEMYIDFKHEFEDDNIILNKNGIDNCEFLIKTNKGSDITKLKDTVSGGEMSRIMLAIKEVFIKVHPASTIVFDEIDTGVSGIAAKAMSDIMKKISNEVNVISISHLHQIVANAEHHIKVSKEDINDETVTIITELNDVQTENEVAKLISGGYNTDALDIARRILKAS